MSDQLDKKSILEMSMGAILERVDYEMGKVMDPGSQGRQNRRDDVMQPQVIICKDRTEWLEARKDGLGASDAAALLGLSPWKTNVQLWEEKCGLVIPEDIGDKPYVRYGNDAEPLLRSFFALDHPEYRVSFTPYKIIKHPDLPFITCTPDGELEETATGRLGGLEIKTTEILSSTGRTHWKGRIPTEYYAQVCQQMLAAGWQFVELLAQIKYTTAEGEDRKETRHYKIERADAEDDIAIIRREAVPFWRCVEQRQKPNLKLPPI